MDREHHEMQFLGLLGIYRESLKLTFNLRIIFSQITLTLILPLVLIVFGLDSLSDSLQYKILFNEFVLSDTRPGTDRRHALSDLLTLERAAYALLEILYFAIVLALSLLSTAAIVYAIASFYASGEIVTFRKIASVVPRVWKRLAVTLSCAFLTFLACAFAFAMTLGAWSKFFNTPDGGGGDEKLGVALLVGNLVAYGALFVYVAMVWQVASVVSVMEDARGFAAVKKGARLLRGKAAACAAVSVKLIAVLLWVYVEYEMHANRALVSAMEGGEEELRRGGWSPRDFWEAVAGYGGACALVLTAAILLGTVVQTVIYMVCKSCHHEKIDKSALADHLEAIYLGEYAPLQGGPTNHVLVEMGPLTKI